MSSLLPDLVQWVTDIVYSFGYPGIAVLTGLGNLHLPVPTELTLPLAGFLVGQGQLSFGLVLLWTTAAAVIAALILYAPGRWFSEERLRRSVKRFGRFLFVHESDLDRASELFDQRRQGHPDRTPHTGRGHTDINTCRHLSHANPRLVHVLHSSRHPHMELCAYRFGVRFGLAMDSRGEVLADRRVLGTGRHTRVGRPVLVGPTEGTRVKAGSTSVRRTQATDKRCPTFLLPDADLLKQRANELASRERAAPS